MRDNDKEPSREVGKPRREPCEARGTMLPKDARGRTFLKLWKEKSCLEMSQPDILMGELATIHFGKCARLSLVLQRYSWTVKQGEPTYSVQARNLCKHIVRTTSTNARIIKQIDDMREALHQAPCRWYATWCEWRRLEETDVQMQATKP